MKFDYHVHSSISMDSTENLMDMVKALDEKGFDGVCFTEHLDPYFPDDFAPFSIDWQLYKSRIEKARTAFPHMEINMGMEAGLNPNSYDEINKQINANDLDFVLGSLHCTDEMTIGEFDYYERYEKRKIQEDYLKCLIKNMRDFDNYDVVAHIGFVSKFAPEPGWELHCKDFSDYINELLKIVVAKGKGIEVNSSGLKRSEHTLPAADIVKRYKELGGEIITFGSDGHYVNYAGYEYQRALEIIKSCGFKFMTRFTERKPIFYEI